MKLLRAEKEVGVPQWGNYTKLSELNKMIYSEEQTLRNTERESLWKKWLWCSDLKEKYSTEIGFNKSHLLGLILCRDYMLLKGKEFYTNKVVEMEHIPARMALGGAVSFNCMNSSTFFRTLKNIQFGWSECMYDHVSNETWVDTENIVLAIFHRLGFFAHYSSKDMKLFDCPATTEVLSDGMLGLTTSAIRGALDVLVILFRHIDIHKRTQVPLCRHEEAKELETQVLIPHAVEATKVYIYCVCFLNLKFLL